MELVKFNPNQGIQPLVEQDSGDPTQSAKGRPRSNSLDSDNTGLPTNRTQNADRPRSGMLPGHHVDQAVGQASQSSADMVSRMEALHHQGTHMQLQTAIMKSESDGVNAIATMIRNHGKAILDHVR